MDPSPPDFRLLQFSSDRLPPRERFDVWRDTLTRKLLHFAIDPMPGHPFKARASLRAQHGVRIGFGEISPSVHHRTRQQVAADNGDLALVVNLRGASSLRQGGAEVALSPGDATVFDCGEPGTYVHREAGQLLCFRFNREKLAPYMTVPEDSVGCLIGAQTPSLRLLIDYLSMLEGRDDDMVLGSDVSRVLVHHLCDLLALTLGAHRDAAAFASGRGLRAARLRSVKRYIERGVAAAGLGSSLGVEDVAAREGVSPRYLRKLFESEGTSFNAYVRDARLQRAHGMLTSQRFAALSITDIAFDVGFGDLSNFNRAFRQRYEVSPREVRARAIEAWRGATHQALGDADDRLTGASWQKV